MIKINLLPQRKQKRPAEPGRAELGIGVGVLLAAAGFVFFAVHRPAAADRDDLQRQVQDLQDANNRARNATKEMPAVKSAVEAEEKRAAAIDQLLGTVIVPDNLLHELGELLTPGHMPTMSREMETRISEGPQGDPNRRFALDWDPKHVWISSFSTKGDDFVLEGGAQSEADVPQLAKRMQASVYFSDVSPQGGQRVTDKDSSITYFQFAITGKVVY